MKVRYIYSACVEIETANTRILCDPWFSEGAFDGSWFHYPKSKDPLKVLKRPDYIYISHIHQDHYDKVFLKKILKKYKKAKIIIPNFKRNYLLNRMKFDGIPAKPLSHLKIKKTNIHLVPNEYDLNDIDSGIIVNDGKNTTLGLVDCVYNKNFSFKLKKVINTYTNKLDLLMAPHSGANNFPHTHFNYKFEKKQLKKWSDWKKKFNLDRYKQWCTLFKSNYHLPYAGKYVLGGKNIRFNKYYGVMDPLDIKKADNKAVILDDYGGEIDLNSGKIKNERKKKYNQKKINSYLNKIKKFKYQYENEIKIPFNSINFKKLFGKSYLKALNFSEVKSDYFYCFRLFKDEKPLGFSAFFNTNKKKKPNIIFNKVLKKPVTIVNIDYRLVFGLLTGIYHWDNASVGSLFESKRIPYKYNENATNFLNFLNI